MIMMFRNTRPRSSPKNDRDEHEIELFHDPRPCRSVAETEYPSARELWQATKIVDSARCRPKFRESSSTSSF